MSLLFWTSLIHLFRYRVTEVKLLFPGDLYNSRCYGNIGMGVGGGGKLRRPDGQQSPIRPTLNCYIWLTLSRFLTETSLSSEFVHVTIFSLHFTWENVSGFLFFLIVNIFNQFNFIHVCLYLVSSWYVIIRIFDCVDAC